MPRRETRTRITGFQPVLTDPELPRRRHGL